MTATNKCYNFVGFRGQLQISVTISLVSGVAPRRKARFERCNNMVKAGRLC